MIRSISEGGTTLGTMDTGDGMADGTAAGMAAGMEAGMTLGTGMCTLITAAGTTLGTETDRYIPTGTSGVVPEVKQWERAV